MSKVVVVLEVTNGEGDGGNSLFLFNVKSEDAPSIRDRLPELHQQWKEESLIVANPHFASDEYFAFYLSDKLQSEFDIELLDFEYMRI